MPEKHNASERRPRAAIAMVAICAAIAILLSASLALCSRKAQARKTPKAMNGAPVEPAATALDRAQGLSPRTGKTDAQAQPPRPSPPLAASLRAFSLRSPSTPRIARDYSLGPLQSYAGNSGDEATILAVSRSFMDGLVEGKLDPKLLLPEARAPLSLLLAPSGPRSGSGMGGGPSYRLGIITIRGEDASLKVRLPSKGGAMNGEGSVREEGLLSLRRLGETWYIQALALDPPKEGPASFEPDPRVEAREAALRRASKASDGD